LIAMLQAHDTLRRQLQALAQQETKTEKHG